MQIDLQHALSPQDTGPDTCGVCGNGFVVSSVMASAATDSSEDMGYVCEPCIAYLGTRSENCPSIELYHELLRQYPTPRWATDEAMREHMDTLAYDYESQSDIYESARLFKGLG